MRVGLAGMVLGGMVWAGMAQAGVTFQDIPTEFIAALGAPGDTHGDNAESWGLWALDPGPRGVWLGVFPALKTAGTAPAGWRYDSTNWWMEEHGLIMEQPAFPLAPGQYLVTGGRAVTAVLTVSDPDAQGHQAWELADGATLADVTHLACRSARYTPQANGAACSPEKARLFDFPVTPGAAMPAVSGCAKQDYQVLFLVGKAG